MGRMIRPLSSIPNMATSQPSSGIGFPDCRSDFEPISERMHNQQMPRLARNVFNLLLELHDQLIERAGGAVIVNAPDFVQKRFARDGVAAFAEEHREDFQLARSQFDRFFPSLSAQRFAID